MTTDEENEETYNQLEENQNSCCIIFSSRQELSWVDSAIKMVASRKYNKFEWSEAIKINLRRFRKQTKISIIQAYLIADFQNLLDKPESLGHIQEQFSTNESVLDKQKLRQSKNFQHYRSNSLVEELDRKNLESTNPKKFYKSAMQLVENHLQRPQNPLNELMTSFYSAFIFRKKTKKENELGPLYLFDDIKRYVEYFIKSLFSFYMIDRVLCQEKELLQYFTQENLSSFCLNQIFANEQIYSYIFTNLSEYYQKDTDDFYKNLIMYKNERPRFFGVPDHLELVIADDFDEDDEDVQELDLPPYSPLRKQTSMEQPYNIAIKHLQRLSQVRTPIHQIKLIAQTTDLIQEAILQFCQRNKKRVIKNFGADELVPILVYVVVRSQVKDLGTYLKVFIAQLKYLIIKIIENFTPRSILNSSAGYKLVTLQTCFQLIKGWHKESAKQLICQSFMAQPQNAQFREQRSMSQFIE